MRHARGAMIGETHFAVLYLLRFRGGGAISPVLELITPMADCRKRSASLLRATASAALARKLARCDIDLRTRSAFHASTSARRK